MMQPSNMLAKKLPKTRSDGDNAVITFNKDLKHTINEE